MHAPINIHWVILDSTLVTIGELLILHKANSATKYKKLNQICPCINSFILLYVDLSNINTAILFLCKFNMKNDLSDRKILPNVYVTSSQAGTQCDALKNIFK